MALVWLVWKGNVMKTTGISRRLDLICPTLIRTFFVPCSADSIFWGSCAHQIVTLLPSLRLQVNQQEIV